jgi:hypothetical protein
MVKTLLKHTTLLILIIPLVSCVQKQRTWKKPPLPLYPIVIDNKVGYIDTSGKVVIAPEFHNAGSFSDSLAFARKDGLFGYIDNSGEFVIQPQFDLARDFSEGFAVVFINQKLSYIDKHGNKIASFNCLDGYSFAHGRAIIQGFKCNLGLINRQGKLIADTIFRTIGDYENGVAAVHTLDDRYGVIDTDGHFVVPLGKYDRIQDYQNGFAYVDLPVGEDNGSSGTLSGFIDKHGNLLFSVNMKDYSFMNEVLSEGLVAIAIPLKKKLSADNDIYAGQSYWGYIDLKGKIIFKDVAFSQVYEFHNGRAFVKDLHERYRIINRRGKYVSNRTFKEVYSERFYKGIALVKDSAEWWRAIDTNGKYISVKKYGEILGVDTTLNLIHYSHQGIKGITTLTGDSVMGPAGLTMEYMDNTFSNENIYYINQHNKIVWRDHLSDKLDNLNIDYFRSTEYVIQKKDTTNNNSDGLEFRDGQLSIILKKSDVDTFAQKGNKYYGSKLYIANNTDTNILFASTCHSLCIMMQALSPDNQWVDIEFPNHYWCCLESGPTVLNPHNYWTIIVPNYEGSIETKLRLKVVHIKNISGMYTKYEKRNEDTLYSNVFEGSINPGQFYSKKNRLGAHFYMNGILSPRFPY